jgi:hypothetical protein
MRRIKGARHAHESMCRQGRTPGDEGRAVIAHNRRWAKERQQERVRIPEPTRSKILDTGW